MTRQCVHMDIHRSDAWKKGPQDHRGDECVDACILMHCVDVERVIRRRDDDDGDGDDDDDVDDDAFDVDDDRWTSWTEEGTRARTNDDDGGGRVASASTRPRGRRRR